MKQLLVFANFVHVKALKEPVSLSNILKKFKCKSEKLDAYYLSVGCAAFVLQAYFDGCFDIARGRPRARAPLPCT